MNYRQLVECTNQLSRELQQQLQPAAAVLTSIQQITQQLQQLLTEASPEDLSPDSAQFGTGRNLLSAAQEAHANLSAQGLAAEATVIEALIAKFGPSVLGVSKEAVLKKNKSKGLTRATSTGGCGESASDSTNLVPVRVRIPWSHKPSCVQLLRTAAAAARSVADALAANHQLARIACDVAAALEQAAQSADGVLYICFRGTATVANALSDIDSRQVEFPIHDLYPKAAEELERRGVIKDKAKAKLRVHRGFYTLIQVLIPLFEQLGKEGALQHMALGGDVVLTGHR